MNRDDVLSAAREAGFNVGRNNINGALFSLTRFAAIIEQRARESERDACAHICYEARNQDVSPLVLYSRIRARADK